MTGDRTEDVGQLRTEVDRTDGANGKGEGCKMCQMVLIASAVMFFAVLWFVFVVRVPAKPSISPTAIAPIPADQMRPLSVEEYNERSMELGDAVNKIKAEREAASMNQ